MVHVDHSVSYSSSSGDTQMAALICVLLVHGTSLFSKTRVLTFVTHRIYKAKVLCEKIGNK